MSMPMPIRPTTRTPAQNPVADAASYASQVLAGINSGTTTTPMPYVQQGSGASRGRLPQRTLSDRVGMVQQGANRQHEMALSRLRKAADVSLPTRGGGGTSKAPSGGYRGAFTGGVYGLTPQAGASLQKLQVAYQQQWGKALPVNSGGRSSADQAYLYNLYKSGKGNLAAPPGSSVHESGRAVDFGGAAHSYSPQHTWLVQNGPKFGWLWAGKNFSQVEPWHFEYQW